MADPQKKKKKSADDTLLVALRAHERQSVGYFNSEIADAQEKALKYYTGQKFGNEIEGRSQVVSYDVAEVIDWMMPSCIRVFLATDKPVMFKANGVDREAIARVQTAYCNHVFMNENDGFRIVHDAFKDGFLQKIGVAKVYWEDTTYEKEEYEGLEPDEAVLLDEDDYEITHATPREDGLIDIAGKRVKSRGKICVESIPPEEFLVARSSASLDAAVYTAHRCWRTKSDLVEMGFSWKEVKDLSSDGEAQWDERRVERFRDEDFVSAEDDGGEESDPTMVRVEVLEEYIRCDYDGDKIAELRQIIRVGDKILSNVEVDDTPWAVYTPVIMPHKFYGQSLADKTMDIQLRKSTFERQMNDNLYLSNNPMKEVPDMAVGEFTIEDMLNNRVGGIIRTAQPGMLREVITPDMSAGALRGIEYLDKIRQQRTGITETNQGLATDTLNPTMGGAAMIMDAANEQKDFYVRNFGETFFKTLFRKMARLLSQYQDWAKAVEIDGEWVEVDPSTFDPDMHVEVQVGLGTGNKQARVQNALTLLGVQQQGMQIGMVGLDELYNTAQELTDAMGLKSTPLYFKPPGRAEPPPPQPDPKMVEVQQKMALQQQEAQFKAELESQKQQFDIALETQKFEFEKWLKTAQFNFEAKLAGVELKSDVALKHESNVLNAKVKEHAVNSSVQFGGKPG